ncbi:hypothetical protein [Lyngbya confervoides]|uniref:Uncharacterized protein n=1 Tax=Lyngbya confervoides BDU141951 TaxID=1574623 RepID=A0ABD4T1G6_9CYAN|nr:hypothetical protein [Lyngbya confervoides]MCM1982328.1 hypothetical protein [Lyngbya confervoides BDU141951]
MFNVSTCLRCPALPLGVSVGLMLIHGPMAMAQIFPSQVVTFTVGGHGTAETSRVRRERSVERPFSFSLSTDNQQIQERRRAEEDGLQIQEESNFSYESYSFIQEKGKQVETKVQRTYDTYSYSEFSVNQSFSVDY